MKQTLALKLGQQLTMTPQLQQAIRLLQLSALDLQQEIQTTLESNPLLELDEDDYATERDTGVDAETDIANGEAEFSAEETPLDGQVESMPDDLPVDTLWDDVYQPTGSASGSSEAEDWDLDQRNSAEETLADHLLWQLNLTPMSERDHTIALAIIDAIDDDGMLTQSVEELTEACNGSANATTTQDAGAFEPVEPDEVCAVLKRIQQFDPVGVAARDLAECLMLQLRPLPDDTPWKQEAIALVGEHLELLAAKDFANLTRRTRLSESDLAQVVALITSLNPRPGASVATEAPEYIVPDVLVKKVKGRWTVELNQDALPKVRVNDLYAGMIKRADASPANAYLRDNLQEARWFLKSLQSRHDTLLKVATQIVEMQRGFFDYGDEAMKPMVLHDIAEAVEMHESTISRVTNRKYMHTPRGIFELKYFFSSHVATGTGGEVSSTAIRALIKKLTAEENPRKPLSDSKIAAILAEQDIQVARRTVAKYRESLMIPPSNERKRLV